MDTPEPDVGAPSGSRRTPVVAGTDGQADVTPLWQVPAAVTDPDRLAAVAGTGLIGGTAVEALDHLTDLAARLLEAPLAFLTMVDAEVSHWVSCAGLGHDDPRQNTVEESFCQYVVTDREPLVVNDAAFHPRTSGNPSIAAMGVRAWAGFPVLDADGRALGSFCVVDTEPRVWDPLQVETLRVLAEAASTRVQLFTREKQEIAARETDIWVASANVALSRMAGLALRLGSVETLQELVEVVVDVGLPALGADGGAIGLRDDPEGVVRLLTAERLGSGAQQASATLPLTSPLPVAYVARTGEHVMLPTQEAGLAFTSEMAAVYPMTGRSAWAYAPLVVDDQLLGSLATAWVDEHECTVGEVRLLDAMASLCAQTVARLRRRDEQQARLLTVRGMSEALQRSLLTQPTLPPHVTVAVRYAPAALEAQVGGDWHDAFVDVAGRLTLVVGDVGGHDRTAAASMGQARNLLRGIALDRDHNPARVLSRLDGALRTLELDVYATAIVAQLHEPQHDADRGAYRVVWSSAGHVPPMLRSADGTVRVLADPPDLLLGVDATVERTDRVLELQPGATLLLYTDGLIERRHTDLELSIRSLADAFGQVGGQAPDLVCEALLRQVAGEDHEDDVAVLVLRIPQ